ncbi:MAG: GIY-YIG nuclease family protein [Chloroflexi bacterium]|nr:GIY-YIG nuclease family protein [Chloroflexota bacterium]MYJ91520.1 GIY-YIG nuclease family protein [Chloroflexota bacterium]
MPKAFSLSVLMPQGEPQGLWVLTKIHWNGVGLFFPRARLEKARERSELNRTGVYVLWNDDDQLRPIIYVGQSEDVSRRLKEHFSDEKMDWWTRAAAFTTKDNAFNQAHARFLEWALTQRAREENRCELQNRITPSKPSISEADEADTSRFLEDVLQCLPLAGLRAFEALVPAGHDGDSERGNLTLCLDRPVIGIQARAIPGVADFTVLKGAQVRRDEELPKGFTNEHPGYRALRSKLIEDGTIADQGGEHYVLKEDWTFSSPSQANVVIAGHPMHPYQVWKDSSGRTWNAILRDEDEEDQ